MSDNHDHKTGYEWLDDAFDDEKTKEDLLKAKQANNRGCLIVLIIFIVLAFVAVTIGLTIIASAI